MGTVREDCDERRPYDELCRYLLREAARCVHGPESGFRHPWIAPNAPRGAATEGFAEGFRHGDYSQGLFHHDASEAAIELLLHEGPLRDAAAGSLLCLLDRQEADGRVHRVELADRTREREPSKPVIAQYALRCADALGDAWADEHDVLRRVVAWMGFLEREYRRPDGLFLTHSSLQSGFDNDLLTAGLPDRSVAGPDTNAFVALEYAALAELGRRLGKDVGDAAEKAAEVGALVEARMWQEDAHGGFYVALRGDEPVWNRDPDGLVRPLESWTSLLPLYAGIPSAERAAAVLRRVADPAAYGGEQGLRTLPRWSPYFSQAARVMHFDFKKGERGPVSNWCGPVWVLSSYYLADGAARYGREDVARALALRTAKLLADGLDRQGALFECYDDAGRGLWPLRGTFISWNVLAISLLRRFAAPAPPR